MWRSVTYLLLLKGVWALKYTLSGLYCLKILRFRKKKITFFFTEKYSTYMQFCTWMLWWITHKYTVTMLYSLLTQRWGHLAKCLSYANPNRYILSQKVASRANIAFGRLKLQLPICRIFFLSKTHKQTFKVINLNLERWVLAIKLVFLLLKCMQINFIRKIMLVR